MKLRRIQLNGFKTFARRSEIDVDPKITAVVGPNGSGKSNVVDAIRWALGETNARELRGARMDEVIYAGGSGKRNRMGLAEVELVFDNESGKLPLEGAEVGISRRVTRGGESEYRINGDRVRLRDLERVLGTTGLTQSGYSVIAQNDIDGIIQATPLQRRSLLEQAAGVRAVRAGVEDSLERIRRADIVLRRLDDLLDDAEPRLAELAVQAEAAIEQRQVSERLAELRGSLAREEWRAARGQLRLARRRLDQALSRAETVAAADTEFNQRHHSQQEKVALARETQRNVTSRLEAARLAAERAAGEARRWLDRQQAAVVHRAQAVAELEVATTELESAEQAVAGVEGGGVEATWEARQEQLEKVYTAHETARERTNSAATALARMEADVAAMQATQGAASGTLQSSNARLQSARDSLQALATESTALTEQLRVLEQEQAAAAADSQQIEETVSEAQAKADAHGKSLVIARQQAAEAEARLNGLRDAARAALASAATLAGQINGALGGTGAVATAVARGELKAVRLVDCFRVADFADAVAIEAALEPHLGAWVAADVEAAARYLQTSEVREEILAVDVGTGDELSPIGGAPNVRHAIHAVNVLRDDARRAVAYCLSQVVLADDITSARRYVVANGGVAILRDGTVVNPIGIRGGGRPVNALELAGKEKTAAAAAEAAHVAEESAAQQLAAANQRRHSAEDAVAASTAHLHEVRVQATEALARRAAAMTASNSERQRLSVLEATSRDRTSEVADAEAALTQAKRDLEDLDQKLAASRQDLTKLATDLVVAREAEASAAEEVRRAEADAADLRAVATDVQQRRALTEAAVARSSSRRTAAAQRVLSAETDAVVALVRVAQRRARSQQLAAEVEAAAQAVEAGLPILAEAERLLAQLETERSEVAIATARAADEETTARAEVDAAHTRVSELADVVREDDQDEGPEPDAQAAEKAEREIVRLERRVSALGSVNGLAPEQHASLSERVGTLHGSRDDIGMACEDIRFLAALLSDEAETRFDSVFGSVASHFSDLFTELFPGGRATLRLEDPVVPNPDEEHQVVQPRGVQILAQPAGKRLQPLSLLSGGERALTALATILALQQVNASPFYVFDEVDAPLDDSNIGRFTRLLKRLSEDQQFIVVTHNHATMAAANVLYGVTIDSDGVSNVLSVRLSEHGGAVPVDLVGKRQSVVTEAVAS